MKITPRILLLLVFWMINIQNISAQFQPDSIQVFQQKYIHEISEKFPGSHPVFFEADPKFSIVADFRLVKKSKIVEFPTSSNKLKTYTVYAILTFMMDHKLKKLKVYQMYPVNQSYQYHVFVPFIDETSGHETYGGGRYLDLDIRDFRADNKIVLDFNKAYNPYCAFSDGYNCPIPPDDNHLGVAVLAGEKYDSIKN